MYNYVHVDVLEAATLLPKGSITKDMYIETIPIFITYIQNLIQYIQK